MLGENEISDLVADRLEQLVICRGDAGGRVVQRSVVDDRGKRGRSAPVVPDGKIDLDRLRMLSLVGENTDTRVEAHRAESDRFTD